MSDRLKARLVAAGTSTFLSLLVAAVLLLSIGALVGRLEAPTLQGDSTVTVALPPLSGDVIPPATGPGAIPPVNPNNRGPGPGGSDGGGTPLPPPPRPPAKPVVGANVSGDVGGLGVLDVNLPLQIGNSSGGSTDVGVDLLGVHVGVQIGDNPVHDVLCLLLC